MTLEHLVLGLAWAVTAASLLAGAVLRRYDELDAADALKACRADPACGTGAERVLRRRLFMNGFFARLKLLLGLYAAGRTYIVIWVMTTPVVLAHWLDALTFLITAILLFWWHVRMRWYE